MMVLFKYFFFIPSTVYYKFLFHLEEQPRIKNIEVIKINNKENFSLLIKFKLNINPTLKIKHITIY